MITIRQMLVDSNKYSIKCPYAMTPKWITVHNTANDASANNEASYMRNNNYEVSFHYVVDDIEAVQGLPLNRNGWHAGDGNGEGNRSSIGIEICYSKSGGSRFDKAEINASQLVAKLLKDYGWGIDRVRTHQSFSGKYCPHRTMDKGWQRFLNMVQAELNKLNGVQQPQQSTTNELYRVKTKEGKQLGAFGVLSNAEKCAKDNKAIIYDMNGKVVANYTQTTPTPPPVVKPPTHTKEKVDVFYKFDNLPWVKNLEDNAGLRGVNARNLYVYPSKGEVLFRVSGVNRDYYSWVQNYKVSNGNYDFAGNGIAIDRVQMKLRGLDGYSIRYRVTLVSGRTLPWVLNDSDFAGIRGQAISNIEIEII